MSINFEINTINFFDNKKTTKKRITEKDVLTIKNKDFIFRKEKDFDYPVSIYINKSFQ